MQTIDWLIVALVGSAALGGYRLGFVARAASWIGMAIGVLVAVRGLPSVLHNATGMSSFGRMLVVMVIMLAGALLGQMAGLWAGSHLSASVPQGRLRTVDHLVGSFVGGLGVLVALWLMLPTAANVPGWTAHQVRSSEIAQAIYTNAPKPPNAMDTLRRLVGSSSFPSVFEGIDPAPDSGPAPGAVTLPESVLASVRQSTVKVEGIACRRTQDGSGFAIGPNLIVTNAHVVAGEKKTTVLTPSGQNLSATVVLFDPDRDLALLEVPKYTGVGLPVASAEVGETGAVFGHPGGQDELAVMPAAVRREIVAVGRDLYDRRQTRRDVLILASELRQGDSGGALVNNDGEVIGVAFAIAPDKPGTAYALNTSELKAVLAQSRSGGPVDTGSCLND